MCMLTFFPGGVQPNLDALRNATYINNDGHGFAIVVGRRIIIRRGLDAGRMIAKFGEVRAKYPDGPALFHSRFGTHGTVSVKNCHPFIVGGDHRTVLAHNGILPKNVRPGKGETRSDTRIAAEDFLPTKPFGSIDSVKGMRRLSGWLGPGNKLVILTVDPRYSMSAYVVNERRGIWDDGIWYSNDDYLAIDYSVGVAANLADGITCPVCGVIGAIDLTFGYCRNCGGCADCGEEFENCFCYAPSKLDTLKQDQSVHAG